jgi:hypothetical protein
MSNRGTIQVGGKRRSNNDYENAFSVNAIVNMLNNLLLHLRQHRYRIDIDFILVLRSLTPLYLRISRPFMAEADLVMARTQ